MVTAAEPKPDESNKQTPKHHGDALMTKKGARKSSLKNSKAAGGCQASFVFLVSKYLKYSLCYLDTKTWNSLDGAACI
jgi:hypothetical protein